MDCMCFPKGSEMKREKGQPLNLTELMEVLNKKQNKKQKRKEKRITSFIKFRHRLNSEVIIKLSF